MNKSLYCPQIFKPLASLYHALLRLQRDYIPSLWYSVDPRIPTMNLHVHYHEKKGTKKVTHTGGSSPFWNLVANLIHLPFGISFFLFWGSTGILWCLTIIGIPFGWQAFKMASLIIWPFGRKVTYKDIGALSVGMNILWLCLTGVGFALLHLSAALFGVLLPIICLFWGSFFALFAPPFGFLVFGLLFIYSIVQIPFALQHLKFAKLAIFPFGTEVK